MSWKSLVCAGLLCALASPALAQPTMQVVGDPTINAAGNFVWTVQVTTSELTGFHGTSLGAEVGFTTPYLGLAGVTANTTDWDHETTGESPFAWTFTDGVETNGNEIMTALGSVIFPGGQSYTVDYVTIQTDGPYYVDASNHGLTTRLTALGAYGGNGRIGEGDGISDTVNFDVQLYVRPGDANLDGSVGGGDYLIWKTNTGGNLTWTGADFNNDGSIGGGDYLIWKTAPNPGAGPPVGAGAGALVAGVVPEPSSLVLMLCGVAFLAVRRR